MRPPIFVRALTKLERDRLEVGLHGKDLYVLRRCQILLASARGEWVPRIAATLGCTDQTVRNVIRELERDGLDACLTRGSMRSPLSGSGRCCTRAHVRSDTRPVSGRWNWRPRSLSLRG